jgi:hypothetical protein
MWLVALGLPRGLDAAEGPAQIIEFAFVRQFLAFGHLNQFQNLVNAIHQNLQTFSNLRGMNDGLMNGGGIGGAEISGFDPWLGYLWFGATLRPGLRGSMMACRAGGLLESSCGRGGGGSRSGGGRFGRLGQIRLAFRRGGGFSIGIDRRVGKIPGLRGWDRFIGRARSASTSASATATATAVVGAIGCGRQI